MTRKKRKAQDQAKTKASETNSENNSNFSKKDNEIENVEFTNHESKRRVSGRRVPVGESNNSAKTKIEASVDKSDDKNVSGVATRRSLRRPASNDNDSSTSPPSKKVKKNGNSRENGPTSSSYGDDSNALKTRQSKNDKKSIDTNMNNHILDKIDKDVPISEDSPGHRKIKSVEKSRKRKLTDVNEESASISTPNTDKPSVQELESKPCRSTESKTESGKVTVDTKKRRKISDSEKDGPQDTNHISQEAKVDSTSTKCSYPIPSDATTQLVDSSQPLIDETEWMEWFDTPKDFKGCPLKNRIWKSSSSEKPADHESCFSISTYNILAESLLKKSHYFDNISTSHWNQERRHQLLMEELHELQSDAFCLQEVEKNYATNLFTKDLSKMGFNVFYACSTMTGSTEGVAICYRVSRFQEVARKIISLSEIADALINELNIPEDHKKSIHDYFKEPQMLQCIILKCERTGKEMCLANTHISYAKHKKPDLQCVQVALGISQILSFTTSIQDRTGNKSTRPMPFIFCGDFNSKPSSATYQLCRDGYLNDAMLNALQNCKNILLPHSDQPTALVNILWKAFQHPADDVESSYYHILNREPPLTLNLKGNSGCVDYMWYTSSGLSAEAVLLPRSSIIRQQEDSLPNADFPSDHLSLSTRLSFK